MLTRHFCGHFGSHVMQTRVGNYESGEKTLQLLTNIKILKKSSTDSLVKF